MTAVRLASIQRLRAVAALSVVLVHAFDLVDPIADPATRAIVDRFWLIDDLGASGVDLFFVLSGFVMALGIDRFAGPGGWRRFLGARARRILPLYWLLGGVLTIGLVAAGETIDPRALANAVTLLPLVDGHAVHLPPLWVGWTLAFETGFYLLVAAATRAARPRAALLALTVAAGAAGLVASPGWAAARIVANPIMLDFAMGVVVFGLWRRGVAPGLVAAAIPAGLLLLFAPRLLAPGMAFFPPQAGGVLDGTTSLTRVLLWGLPWALVTLGATCVERRGGADALTRIGDASYAIYLTHAILMAETVRQGWAVIADPRLVVFGFTLVSVAAGIAVHHWIERPLARLFARQSIRSAFSASTTSPLSVTSANPPSIRMRPVTVLIEE